MNIFTACWLFSVAMACGYCIWAIKESAPSPKLQGTAGGEQNPAVRGRPTPIDPDADIDHILPITNAEEVHR